MLVRTASVALVHTADKAAENGNIAGVERAHYLLLFFKVCVLLFLLPFFLLSSSICSTCPWLDADWLNHGMVVGGGMVVAVGYAMVINMMATREVWPFFAIGFALAAISQLTLIALGAIGVAIAFVYLNLSKQGGGNGGGTSSGSGDPIGDILEDY
ncbi:MAG: PTS sugar transporter subunit IIC [Streptococcus sp.]